MLCFTDYVVFYWLCSVTGSVVILILLCFYWWYCVVTGLSCYYW